MNGITTVLARNRNSGKIVRIITGMSSDWIQESTTRIGQELRHLRGKRSVQWLADRTKALGSPISRTTISEIENGKRKSGVSVQELVILAVALEVPPVQLLYPEQPYGTVEFIPNNPMTSVEAADAFSGIESPKSGDEAGKIDTKVMQAARHIRQLDLTAQADDAENLARIVQAFQDTPGAPDVDISDLIAQRAFNARHDRLQRIKQIEALLGREVPKQPGSTGA